MAPVTEFVFATRSASGSLDVLEKSFQLLKQQPGNQAVRASVLHENADQFRLFIDWDSIDSHYAFRSKDVYKNHFLGEVASHVAGPATVVHAELSPFPPTVLDSAKTPVAEVLFTYFAPEADAAKNLAAAQALVSGLSGAGFAGMTGESALGWSVEKDVDFKGDKTRALILLLGWESVDAHQKARATDVYGKLIAAFQGAAEGLKG